MLTHRLAWATAALIGMIGSAARSETPVQADTQDLSRLSLEELAQVEVTSVSRRAESLTHAAASVYVITRDDIRRSGATSLPEVLRLAPNLSVQRLNSVDYAVSARGFNGYETSNKLLVLIDGRSIYSTLHSGVFWDAYDVMLENVERIEVISGPGGALYGSNAMNGVINVITRSADQTDGLMMSGQAGEQDQVFSARIGRLFDGGGWRVYGRLTGRGDTLTLAGEQANDAAEGLRAGARADWSLGEMALTLQGDLFDNSVAINEDALGTPTTVKGRNLLGRLTRPLAGGELQVQAYADHFEREEPSTRERATTLDLAFQHARDFGDHQLVIGAGHRVVDSSVFTAPGGASLDPAERTLHLTNVFVQDQWRLSERLILTLGVKFEDNSFSGQEVLPSLRLAWETSGGDLFWGAISRASRTPNRIERDLTLPGFLEGGDFHSETAVAYEAGYRARPRADLSFSISAFYNVYEELRTASLHPVTLFPVTLTNFGAGESWGVEAWGSYDVNPRWRIGAGVSTLTKDFTAPPGSDITGLASVGDDPDYQVLLRNQAQLTERLALDTDLRAVGALSNTDDYVEADARLGWRVTDRVELSLVGRNLLNDSHVETGDPLRRRAFGRSVYAGFRVGF